MKNERIAMLLLRVRLSYVYAALRRYGMETKSNFDLRGGFGLI